MASRTTKQATDQSTLMPPPPPPPPPRSTNGERPRKRVRLSHDAQPSIATRQMAHLETSLEVDHMMLDYLVYQAINTCFAARITPRHGTDLSPVERSLLQADEFLHLFQHRYSRHRPHPQLRFRQQLLQLVALVTQRFVRGAITPPTSSLQRLRDQSQTRVRKWIGDASRIPTAKYDIAPFETELPLSAKKLHENRAHVLELLDVPAEDHHSEDAFFGTSGYVSLLDILPLFMRVSASCHALFAKVTSQWMQLAADWMLQACLEQYLICGKDGSDAIDEAFAWGYKPSSETGLATEMNADAPFDLDHDKDDVRQWRTIRDQALATLFPKRGKNGELDGTLVWHLGATAVTRPITKTQENIVNFLQSLAEAIDKPVLAQLETGQLDGMSKVETREFMRDCGLDVANFYPCEPPLEQMDTT